MRLIISIILVLAAVAVLFFWGRVWWQDVQALQAERDAFESVIGRINQLRKTRDGLLLSYNTIPAQDLQKIKNLIPSAANSGPLVVQFANLTNQSGLLLKNVNLSEPETKSGVLMATLSVSGSYENFTGFLASLEKSLRLIDLSKLSFSAGRDNFYDFSLELKTYTQK